MSRFVTLVLGFLMVSACGPALLMPMPPGVTVIDSPEKEAELLARWRAETVAVADFAVKPGEFPTYHVPERRQPPAYAVLVEGKLQTPRVHMVRIIEPGDRWHVRYRIDDHLLIGSPEFDRRQCPALRDPSQCQARWCVYISQSGYVTGGWDRCPCVGCERAKFQPAPDVAKRQEWKPQPYFVPAP